MHALVYIYASKLRTAAMHANEKIHNIQMSTGIQTIGLEMSTLKTDKILSFHKIAACCLSILGYLLRVSEYLRQYYCSTIKKYQPTCTSLPMGSNGWKSTSFTQPAWPGNLQSIRLVVVSHIQTKRSPEPAATLLPSALQAHRIKFCKEHRYQHVCSQTSFAITSGL